jgi:hypothetical protein
MLLQVEQLAAADLVGSGPSSSSSSSASSSSSSSSSASASDPDQDGEGTAAADEGAAPALSALYTSAQMHCHLLFNAFVAEQCRWIEESRATVKQAGVLPPIAKLPAFVDRCACGSVFVCFFFLYKTSLRVFYCRKANAVLMVL